MQIVTIINVTIIWTLSDKSRTESKGSPVGGASLPRLYRNLDTTVIPNHRKCIGVFRQTLSPDDCVAAFDMSHDLKGSITLTKRLSKLCHTAVAKMPQ